MFLIAIGVAMEERTTVLEPNINTSTPPHFNTPTLQHTTPSKAKFSTISLNPSSKKGNIAA